MVPALHDDPFAHLPGAVLGTDLDAGVPAHYGNPLGEQRALVERGAIVDLGHRSVISVAGEDRLGWLDSVSSQRLTGLGPGESADALLLSPSGRIEHALRVIDDGETLWIIVEHDEGEPLLAWLESMRFMMRVEPRERSAEFAVIGSLSEPVAQAAAPGGVPLVWRDPWPAVAAGGYQYASEPEHPGAEWTWSETIVARADLGAVVQAATVGGGALSGRGPGGTTRGGVAGMLAVEALRIAAWRPRFDTEVDERSVPHELDWLRTAVHLEKGCYRGQETVAKVHNLGHPPRRLVMLHLDGSEAVLPRHGAEVWYEVDGERRAAGMVTASGIHYELGPIALGLLKRTVPTEAQLNVDEADVVVAAAQEVIVPPDAGSVADVPRLPRLGR